MIFRKWGGGSKAVWNFSENSSVLEWGSFPYAASYNFRQTLCGYDPDETMSSALQSFTAFCCGKFCLNIWVEENLWIVHEAALVWLKRPYVRFMDFFARKQKGPSLYLVFVLCLQICNSRSLGWLCPSTSRSGLGWVKFVTVMRLYGEWTICIDALMT